MFLGEGAEGQATTWEREQEHLKNVANCQEQFGRARLTQRFIPAEGFQPDVLSLWLMCTWECLQIQIDTIMRRLHYKLHNTQRKTGKKSHVRHTTHPDTVLVVIYGSMFAYC